MFKKKTTVPRLERTSVPSPRRRSTSSVKTAAHLGTYLGRDKVGPQWELSRDVNKFKTYFQASFVLKHKSCSAKNVKGRSNNMFKANAMRIDRVDLDVKMHSRFERSVPSFKKEMHANGGGEISINF